MSSPAYAARSTGRWAHLRGPPFDRDSCSGLGKSLLEEFVQAIRFVGLLSTFVRSRCSFV